MIRRIIKGAPVAPRSRRTVSSAVLATVLLSPWFAGSAAGASPGTLPTPEASGDKLWSARYEGPVDDSGSPEVVAVSPDGRRVFVTGTSAAAYATVAYDSETGHTIWVRRLDIPASDTDHARAIAVSPDGQTVFVTGNSGQGHNDAFLTVAYAAATGTVRWVSRYGGTPSTSATSIGTSPDGYDSSTGQERWVRRSNVGENEFAVDLVTSPDGSLVIIGGSIGPPWPETTSDYLTIAYDSSTGAARWARRFGVPEGGDDDVVALAMAPDGSKVFVTGESDGIGLPHHIDYVTIAYDAATGTRQWLKRYDGPGVAWDEVHAIDVSPDSGKVVITGQSGWTADDDYVTIAYEA
jgi:WD40 repeat protein